MRHLARRCTILALMAHTVHSACVRMTVGFRERMRSSSRVYRPFPDVMDSVTNLSTSAGRTRTQNPENRVQRGAALGFYFRKLCKGLPVGLYFRVFFKGFI